MVRVKRGKIARKKRKKLLKKVKGFKWGRKSKYRLAKQALMKALEHSLRDRKRKKREFRRLWQVQINAFLRERGLKYSQFIYALKKNKIEIDRKILAQLANSNPKVFEAIIEKVNLKKE